MDHTHNLHGGLQTHGSATRNLLSIHTQIDLETLAGWEQARLYAGFQTKNGEDGSASLTSDLQAQSNIDADDFTALYEFWYEQIWDESGLRIKLGKIDANDEFAFTECGGDFIHSSSGHSPTILGFPTYAEPATAMVLEWGPASDWSFLFGVFDGAAQEGYSTGTRGPSTFFGSPSDLFLIAEARFGWDWNGRRGRWGLGGWHHTGTFDRFDGSTDSGTEGGYLVFDQNLWTDAGSPDRSLELIAQFGWADDDISPITRHIGMGFVWTGPLPDRPRDSAGCMIHYARLTDDPASGLTESNETACEIYYRFVHAPYTIQPVFQYIRNPGGAGGIPDALAFTLRFQFAWE